MSDPTDRSRRPAARRTLTRAALALGGVLGAALALAVPAAAEDGVDTVVRYSQTIELAADGTADVVLDLDMDFGESPNHGPYLTYVVKQRHDDTQDRIYRFRDVRATSETAAADVHLEENEGWVEIRIGDEDSKDVTGVHSYRVTYTVEGWVNAAGAFDLRADELYLNVIGDHWVVPMNDVSVQVTGPAEVTGAECFAGSQEECTTVAHEGTTASFEQATLSPGEQLTVLAQFPAGTFAGAEPILQDRWSPGRAFALTPGTSSAAAAVALGGGLLVVTRMRRRGQDEQHLGLTPGLMPAEGQEHAVGARRHGSPTVRFTPPEGFRPGQIGTLVDERADPHDVTATIIDLAVRGWLSIERTTAPDDSDEDDDWVLHRSDRSPDQLLGYERALLDELFEGRTSVRLSELRTTFSGSMTSLQTALYEDVTERGWFRGNPQTLRNRWAGRGILLFVAGVALTVVLAIWTSWALVGVAVVVLGVVLTSMSGTAPARTADGSAILAQAEGFRLYLETAEGDQLRFEEGEDLFSRYLPYAVAFGITERWAQVFADLAAQGRAMVEPAWYTAPGYAHGAFWAHGATLGHELSSFTSLADTSLTAPTPGSSGSSGGGGFSGGGVGGGGGGSW
ncbi:DUF2207 domain-containing protein [Actinotalea sp. K2]|uniref:DUF2207 domain-containing protein n=1 Tax=Actinotalea sp. K2 TaxID=2939438 RepID=UPI002016E2DB|nr:DUF2207 domain-containing protein [Actinotalea sp. K2]MCL3862539.1 DUF2207 domain-containing protein [Actinotalea sp. K2]